MYEKQKSDTKLLLAPPKKEKIRSKRRWLAVTAAFLVGIISAYGVLGILVYFTVFRNFTRVFSNTASAAPVAPVISGKVDAVKKEGDGLLNVLILGFDQYHSDTILVATINPETGHSAMLSLPRDMWVPNVKGLGKGAKINNIYLEAENNKKGSGLRVVKQAVGEILDVNIHYVTTFDWTGFIKIVDAIGGVTVDVPYLLDDYSNNIHITAGRHHLNGNQALKFARCRKNTCRRDFGRQERQQVLVKAVGAKMMKSGFHLNPVKIFKLMDGVGKHVKTDIGQDQILDMVELAQKVNFAKIETKVLGDGYDQPLISGWEDPYGSVLKPRAGNFSVIRKYFHSMFVDPNLAREHAKIELKDATKNTARFNALIQKLKSYGYTVFGKKRHLELQKTTTIIDYSAGKKPYTIRYLELRFGTQAVQLPRPTGSKADVLVVVGDADLPFE